MLRITSLSAVIASGCALAACRATPELTFLPDEVLASDAAVGVTGSDGGDDGTAVSEVRPDATLPDGGGPSADGATDAAARDAADDDATTATGVCPSSSPPTGVACCGAVACIGDRCGNAGACNQCQRNCGTAEFCCATQGVTIRCERRAKLCL